MDTPSGTHQARKSHVQRGRGIGDGSPGPNNPCRELWAAEASCLQVTPQNPSEGPAAGPRALCLLSPPSLLSPLLYYPPCPPPPHPHVPGTAATATPAQAAGVAAGGSRGGRVMTGHRGGLVCLLWPYVLVRWGLPQLQARTQGPTHTSSLTPLGGRPPGLPGVQGSPPSPIPQRGAETGV